MQKTKRTEETDPRIEAKIENGPDTVRATAVTALEREGIPAAPIHVVMALVDRLAMGEKS